MLISKLFKFVIFVILPIKCFCELNGNNDFQVWNYNTLNVNLKNDKTFQLTVHFKWGDDASKLYNKHLEFLLIYHLGKYIDLAPGYRQVWSLNRKDQWKKAFAPMVDLTIHFAVKNWFIRDRNRVILHLGNFFDRSTTWVYRNQLEVGTPWEWTRMKIKPFASYEVFWQQGSGISQLRPKIGTHFKIYGALFGTLAYIRRSLETAEGWTHQNVLEINARINFLIHIMSGIEEGS